MLSIIFRTDCPTDPFITRLAAITLASLLCLALFGSVSAADEQEGGTSPDIAATNILRQWQQRREEVRTFEASAKGTMIIPKGAYDGELELAASANGTAPTTDYECPFSGSWLIDIPNNRLRMEWSFELFNLSRAEFHPVHDLVVYNGDDLREHCIGVTETRGRHYGAFQPEFLYRNTNHPVIVSWALPVFFGVGIVPLDENMDTIRSLSTASARKQDLSLHGHGEIDGATCTILRTSRSPFGNEGYLQLWVDESRNGAIVKCESYAHGTLRNTVDITYGRDGDTWMPTHWTCIEYIGDERSAPARITTADLSPIKINVPVNDADFILNPAPGMIVADKRIGKSYRLGENGEQLRIDTTVQIESDSTSTAKTKLTWIVISNVLVIAIIALIIIIIRRRSKLGRS